MIEQVDQDQIRLDTQLGTYSHWILRFVLLSNYFILYISSVSVTLGKTHIMNVSSFVTFYLPPFTPLKFFKISFSCMASNYKSHSHGSNNLISRCFNRCHGIMTSLLLLVTRRFDVIVIYLQIWRNFCEIFNDISNSVVRRFYVREKTYRHSQICRHYGSIFDVISSLDVMPRVDVSIFHDNLIS